MSTMTWIGSAGGDWATAADWSSGVAAPGAGDDILITQPGTYIVTESQAEAVHSVTLAAANATLVLDAPLSVAGAFTVNAGTVVFNGGTVSANSFTLNGGLLSGNTVDVVAAGSIALQGGTIASPHAVLTDANGTIRLPYMAQLQTGGVAAPQAVGWTQTMPFAQFNPALGTLAQLEVGVSAAVAGSVSIQSLDGSVSTVAASFRGLVSVTDPTGVVMDSVAIDPVSTASGVGAAGGTYASVLLTPGANTTGSVAYAPTTAEVAAFSGIGSVPLTLQATASLHLTGPANIQIASQASAAATASLRYAYGPTTLGSGTVYDSGGIDAWAFLYNGDNPYLNFQPTNALTTAPQTFTYADRTTGWQVGVPVQQFDPSLGRLIGVSVTLVTDINGSVAAENETASAAPVITTQVATATLGIPDGATVATTGTITDSMALGAYDGSADNAGTSGRTDAGLHNPGSVTTDYLIATQDLSGFIGQGTVDLPLTDLGSGTLDGPALLSARLLAQSGATVTVSYDYLPAQTLTWSSAASGDWATAADWSAGTVVPTVANDVVINQAGTYVITQSQAEAAASIEMNAPGATLVVDAPLSVAGAFVLDAGTVEFNGGTLFAGTVDLNGGVVSGGNVSIVSGSSILVSDTINSSGTVKLTAESTIDATGSAAITAPLVDLVGSTFSVGSASINTAPVEQIVSSTGASLLQTASQPPTVSAFLSPSGHIPGHLTPGNTSDILFGNANGGVALWTVQNGTVQTSSLMGQMSSGWTLAGTGDFYGNGITDPLFVDASGDVAQWQIQNGQPAGATLIGTLPQGSSLVGTGDMYGNGTDSVLLQNAGGVLTQWQIQNGQSVAATTVGTVSAGWSLVAIGNLSSYAGWNAPANLLFINTDGVLADWTVQNGQATAVNVLGRTSSYWSVLGIGDFTASGQNDILFRSQAGDLAIWTLQNGQVTGAQEIGVASADWQVAGIGDYNGDGTSDILFRHTSGAMAVWEVSNGQLAHVVSTGAATSDWQVVPGGHALNTP
jgi:hypothetical protein